MTATPRHRAVRTRRRPRSLTALIAAAAVVVAGSFVAFAGSASAATQFSDTFDDGDTAGWSRAGGAWTVTSDGGRVLTQSKVTAEPSRLFAGDTRWADYSVQARVKPVSFSSPAGLVGIAGRSAGATSYVRLAILGSGKAQLQSVRSGAVTVLGTSSASFAPGSFHTLRLEMAGSSVRGLVDGAQVAAGTTAVRVGRLGLQTVGGTASFDDVTTEDVAGGPNYLAHAVRAYFERVGLSAAPVLQS